MVTEGECAAGLGFEFGFGFRRFVMVGGTHL